MLKSLLLPLFLLLATLLAVPGCAQKGPPVVYMQIFFEGPNWLAGREVLHYTPAFKGKTGELVAEGADTQEVSPMRFMQGPTRTTYGSSTSGTTVTTDKGTFVTDADGKTHQQTEEDIRKENQVEQDNMNRGLQLLEKRARLAREALTKALNEAAADGWEVVQMTATGTSGSLVYLLRKR
ncbi:DUF4177 domain-containing protein [Hymenobacter sp. DH14]|uniref:DUF4177 domain-containing protein n=1 Tax=Hymenobacter cyanobacteriorum TaxID=2926463 RepID=A0A9X1VH80_9BACT|nr:DUF4177 domain-containing protein [Hymenobacter cyanobacteriorum]MCI1188550.1 DUF4177 domain-containing protein [Hymenobacter cyanobacteriorum]